MNFDKVELVFVPLWVQRALTAAGMSLQDALDESKCSCILSTTDLELYRKSQDVLRCHDQFRQWANGSFKLRQSAPHADIPYAAPQKEDLLDYIYGQVPMGTVRSDFPEFTCSVSGETEAIIVSVVNNACDNAGPKPIFMEKLIEQLLGLRPMEHVASLPVFKHWMKRRGQSCV